MWSLIFISFASATPINTTIDTYFDKLPPACHRKLYLKLMNKNESGQHRYLEDQVKKGLFCLEKTEHVIEDGYYTHPNRLRIGSYNSPSWR